MADKRRRYNQRDNNPKKEYQRLSRNTKAKMKYVQEKYGLDLSYEVEIPSYQELMEDDSFDDWSEQMTSFTDRNNLNYQFERNAKGMVYSKAELLEGLENTKQAQENAQNFIDRFKDKEYSIGGEEAGYTVGDRMILYKKENVAGITVPEDFDIDAFETRDRLTGKLELLQEKADGVFFDRSMRQMQSNFIKSVSASFNSEGDDIVDMISAMPEDDFFELFLMKAEFTFEDYASDGSIDGTEEQAELLRGYLKEYYRGEIDMELKGYYLKDRGSIPRNGKLARRVRKTQGKE